VSCTRRDCRSLAWYEVRRTLFYFALANEAASHGTMKQPKLQFLHSENALNSVKLAQFRRLSTDVIASSLQPGQSGCLKARPDGTVLDGHHRLAVLLERGEDIHSLAREIMVKEDHES
jgi:hypothetical protein